MNKKQAISYIRSYVGNDRHVSVKYVFDSPEQLPAVIRLKGIDGHVDVPIGQYKEKLLTIKNSDEVLTIGRAHECDFQADDYENNLISRIHVVWQKVGEKFYLINCGIYGISAFAETPDGLQELPAQDEPWADFEK
jgi:hypothetical protein